MRRGGCPTGACLPRGPKRSRARQDDGPRGARARRTGGGSWRGAPRARAARTRTMAPRAAAVGGGVSAAGRPSRRRPQRRGRRAVGEKRRLGTLGRNRHAVHTRARLQRWDHASHESGQPPQLTVRETLLACSGPELTVSLFYRAVDTITILVTGDWWFAEFVMW